MKAQEHISSTMAELSGYMAESPSKNLSDAVIEKAFVFGDMPARNAVQAALFSAAGFSAVEDVLSGEHNYFDVFTDDPHPEELTNELGERHDILDANLKKRCVGMLAQSPLDAIEILIDRHDVRP